VNGVISVIGTFANCLRNIADPMLLPSMRDGQITSQMVVNNTIQFNNLHLVCPLSSFFSLSLSPLLASHLACSQIDAVEGSATLDFYLRLRWTDNRVDMPLFWAKMGKKVQFVDITSLYQDEVLAVWLPDIRFHDVSNVEYLAQVPSLALTCLLTSLMTTLSPSLSSHSLSLCLSLSVSLSLSLSLCLSLSLSLSLPH
jgi:hypothetical protein